LEFMKQHNIKRLYLRMFDVAAEHNLVTGTLDIVPIATTQFEDCDRWRLEGVEVIPTTYITIEALREIKGKEKEYAELIVERLRAMATHNKLGKICEMQFDCDWTTSTQQSYFRLCEASRDLLKADSIALSSTIRLHQISQNAPPVDRGVLMLYNTGNLKSIETRNSILDIKDVEPYLKKKIEYPIPLDYVYPTFGWGVKFYQWGDFKSIVSNPETETTEEGETMRIERPTVEEILAVKKLIENKLGKSSRSNIIYHLDKDQLKHYSQDEINKIFSNN
ncbi:MAG: hypothetical protein IIW65_07575, partial [Alistipes sp.]|nr:hypothetical protein [Alistipes sp.]